MAETEMKTQKIREVLKLNVATHTNRIYLAVVFSYIIQKIDVIVFFMDILTIGKQRNSKCECVFVCILVPIQV